MGRPSRAALTTPGVVAKLADERVRAVAALAPVGVVFKPDSLAAIRVPTVVYSADLDRFLVPRFHAEAVAAAIPSSQLRRVGNASHFAFMDPPTMAIPSPDGDLRADPAGFDRLAFLDHLGQDICDCFDRSLR